MQDGHLIDEEFDIRLKSPGPIEQFFVENAIKQFHYLHKYPDPRCMSFIYSVFLRGEWVGCLVFGRPQAGRLFKGPITYGSLGDIESGRAQYCRWEVLNLARVWFSPSVQREGEHCWPQLLPGFYDRKGNWRSSFASTVIRAAIDKVRIDYLLMFPPVFFQKYNIKVVLSYCDTRIHRGVVYSASGFHLASKNRDKIETWTYDNVTPLSPAEDTAIRYAGKHHPRSIQKRNVRSVSLPPGFLFGAD